MCTGSPSSAQRECRWECQKSRQLLEGIRLPWGLAMPAQCRSIQVLRVQTNFRGFFLIGDLHDWRGMSPISSACRFLHGFQVILGAAERKSSIHAVHITGAVRVNQAQAPIAAL